MKNLNLKTSIILFFLFIENNYNGYDYFIKPILSLAKLNYKELEDKISLKKFNTLFSEKKIDQFYLEKNYFLFHWDDLDSKLENIYFDFEIVKKILDDDYYKTLKPTARKYEGDFHHHVSLKELYKNHIKRIEKISKKDSEFNKQITEPIAKLKNLLNEIENFYKEYCIDDNITYKDLKNLSLFDLYKKQNILLVFNNNKINTKIKHFTPEKLFDLRKSYLSKLLDDHFSSGEVTYHFARNFHLIKFCKDYNISKEFMGSVNFLKLSYKELDKYPKYVSSKSDEETLLSKKKSNF